MRRNLRMRGVSLRELHNASWAILSGGILFSHEGNGSGDIPEIVGAYEVMILSHTLVLSMLIEPFFEACSMAPILDSAVIDGLGLLWLILFHHAICSLTVVILQGLVVYIILPQTPTPAEGTLLVGMAHAQIRFPLVLWILSLFLSLFAVNISAFLKANMVAEQAAMYAEDHLLAGVDFVQTNNESKSDELGRRLTQLTIQTAQTSGSSAASAHAGAVGSSSAELLMDQRGDGRVNFGFGGHRYVIALSCDVIFWIAIFWWWASLIIAKQRHVRTVLGAGIDAESMHEIDHCMAASTRRPWFATLSSAQLRQYLDDYFALFEDRGPLGDALSMEHCLEFVLRLERTNGAGDLSITSRKCAPSAH